MTYKCPDISEESFRKAAIRTCKAFNGHEGCRCAGQEGQYCEAILDVLSKIFYKPKVDQAKMIALINGHAHVRLNPRC